MALSENTQSLSEEQAALVQRHMGYARNVAAKAAQKLPIEVSDAIQLGYEGLLQAAYRFNVAKHDSAQGSIDNHFRSYAHRRIVGAVFDHARKDSFVGRKGRERGIEFKFESLDMATEDGFVPRGDIQAPVEDLELAIDFKEALAELTERERFVVLGISMGLRFYEIGNQLGVSESRVSQIAKKARTKLTERLGDHDLC